MRPRNCIRQFIAGERGEGEEEENERKIGNEDNKLTATARAVSESHTSSRKGARKLWIRLLRIANSRWR